MIAKWIIPIILILVFSACSKNEDKDIKSGELSFDVSHHVDGVEMQSPGVYYTNAAGNQYRITMLKYFISGVELYKDDKLKFRQKSHPEIINGTYADGSSFRIKEIPITEFDSIAFSLGVVPEFNYDGAFELDYDAVGMYWPANMGGGYHFMRFEGHWKHAGDFGGFAFHLGADENLLTSGFPLTGEIKEGEAYDVKLAMNLNEWFTNPHLYDLRIESGYTMGDTVKMKMLLENGAHVFTLNYN